MVLLLMGVVAPYGLGPQCLLEPLALALAPLGVPALYEAVQVGLDLLGAAYVHLLPLVFGDVFGCVDSVPLEYFSPLQDA